MQSLDQILESARQKKNRILAVAAAEDKFVLMAVKEAVHQGMVQAKLVGDQDKIKAICQEISFEIGDRSEIIHENSPDSAAKTAVSLVSSKKADFLMKGNIGTGPLLKCVLDREYGLRTGRTLSHVAIFKPPYYEKLLCITDAAMNVAPDLKAKADIITNSVLTMQSLGIKRPKVAVLAAVETVNPDMSATLDAAALVQMGKRNQIKDCDIDGPLALDNAVSKTAAQQKNIDSPVAGFADILVAPDIEAGNILYKTLTFLANCHSASIIVGATAPVVLTSRADSEEAKLLSIALGTLAVI